MFLIFIRLFVVLIIVISFLFCSYVLSSRKKIMWDINLLGTAVNLPWGNANIGQHNTVCIFHTCDIASNSIVCLAMHLMNNIEFFL